MFKIGEEVSVLNDSIYGKVISINNKIITIEDQFGFDRKYKIEQLVLRVNPQNYKLHKINIEDSEKEELFVKEIKPKSSAKEKTKNVSLNDNEIDLHIDSLVKDYQSLSAEEIIQKQMIACRNFVEKAISKKLKKIVLIHGKGEGFLRSEIHLYLIRLENTKHVLVEFNDGDPKKYGIKGATEVILR